MVIDPETPEAEAEVEGEADPNETPAWDCFEWPDSQEAKDAAVSPGAFDPVMLGEDAAP